jgi:insertion element IS1 protein InsB
MNCPKCHATHIVRNGFSPGSCKQKYRCQGCKKQFVDCPEKHPLSEAQKKLCDRLLLERISLSGICRVVGVSERWLQYYVNEKYANVPRQIRFSGKSQGILTLECDEVWSYVGKKQEKQWIWLALDRDTREIVEVIVVIRVLKHYGSLFLWNVNKMQ